MRKEDKKKYIPVSNYKKSKIIKVKDKNEFEKFIRRRISLIK